MHRPIANAKLNSWERAYCLAVSLTILLSLVQTDTGVQTGLNIVLVGLFPVGVAIVLLNRRRPPAFAVVSCVLMTGFIGLLMAFVAIVES